MATISGQITIQCDTLAEFNSLLVDAYAQNYFVSVTPDEENLTITITMLNAPG